MKKILLVEDQPIAAITTQAILKKNNYNVATVKNGESAYSTAMARDYDVILMDIDLGGGINGIEAAIKILEEKYVPIIFLSSIPEEEVKERTEGVNSCGYVAKISGEEVLIPAIKKCS